MTHPNSLALEAFACGEPSEPIAAHVRDCSACGSFVERLRGALSSGPSKKRAAEVVGRVASRSPERRRWLFSAGTIAVPLVAAAALVFLVRTPSTREALVPPPAAESTTARPLPTEAPETTFKGSAQVAVIRERGGHQERFTGRVPVQAGDRLRVEVALDREQDILGAIMGDDGSWLELMPDATRGPGTHFSDRSARVDASPLSGTILVGSHAAVERARSSHRFDDVTTVRVEWSAP